METEQNLRSLQDQAATTKATLAKIDEAGEKLQNIGSSVENVGKKFLPVTAAASSNAKMCIRDRKARLAIDEKLNQSGWVI